MRCQAEDSDDNSSEVFFTINVVDTTPPVVTVNDDDGVDTFYDDGSCSDPFGTNVFYQDYGDDVGPPLQWVNAFDNGDLMPTLTCSPASGTFFDEGPTEVGCSATDSSGNTSAMQFFDVFVFPAEC